jgi:hypothetical protein
MKKSQFTQEEVNAVMESRGISRKSALKFLNKDAKSRKTKAPAPAKDFKSAAAHDVGEAPAPKLPAKNASLVAKGAAYHVLAGRPSKDAVVKCFGKSGYALSWVSRAERLGVSPQELCEAFAANPNKVADKWAALEAK